MNRYYFVTKDLEDLVHVEQELEQQGVLKEQMHVLPYSDAVAEESGLESVHSLFRKDILGSLGIGFGVGCAAASLFLLVAYFFFGVAESQTWMMLGIIALMIVGVCTWEGGLMGIHWPKRQFRRFGRDLKRGFSVFFVDIEEAQEQTLVETVKQHRQLQPVGNGSGESTFFIKLRHYWHRYSGAA